LPTSCGPHCSRNTKWSEIGRLAFFAGLFVFLLQWGPQLVGKG